MKQLFLLAAFIILNSIASAQYNTLYSHYYTPLSGQALTVIDENNVQFDIQGKIYTMLDRESLRFSILTCLNTSGGVDWIDTLTLPAYLQSSNANFKFITDRIYAIATYGNNLNSSIAEAVAITKYNLNGTILNQVVLSNTGTNFRSQEIYVQPNTNIIATYLTNDMMTNWTLHVDCYDSSLNPKWTQSFPWPSYSNTGTPGTNDNNSNFYVSYTTDSIVSGNYYRKAFIHKIDSSGNLQWTKNVNDKRYKILRIDYNGYLISGGETIAPLVIVSNNIGDVLVTKINSLNGNQIWETMYNATSNEKEILNDMDVDNTGQIILGGNQDVQDISTNHYKGFANIYNNAGVLVQNIVKPTLEVVYATQYLNSGKPIVRSATSTDLHLSEYTYSGIFLAATNLNFANGASWSGMDILANDDIALAVSDVLCSDRGVTAIRLSKTPSAVTNIEQRTTVSIYPNPALNKINIQCPGKINTAKVINMMGENFTLLPLQNNAYDIQYLPAGFYSIILNTDKGDYHSTMIKK